MAIGELERKSEEKRNLGGSKMGLQARTAIPTQDVAYGSPRLDCPSRLSLLKSRGIPNHEYTSPDWLVFKRERERVSPKKKRRVGADRSPTVVVVHHPSDEPTSS
jgi:hypothetical protein